MAGNDYGFTLVTGPTEEPVSRIQAKKQCELPQSDRVHDNHLDQLIIAARQRFEIETNRQLLTATWDYVLDQFPCNEDRIYIPKPPLQSITSITYTDSDGASQTLATSVYKVLTSREPGRVSLKYGQVWPVTYDEEGVVTVRFVAGYASQSAVPAGIQQAILMMVGHYFEHREEVVVGTNALPLPMGVQHLIDAYRVGDGYFNYGHEDSPYG